MSHCIIDHKLFEKKKIIWHNGKLKPFIESYYTGRTKVFYNEEEYKGVIFLITINFKKCLNKIN